MATVCPITTRAAKYPLRRYICGNVTTSGSTHPITDQIFNGLVGLDEQFRPVPELAERWQITDGGKTYSFSLRPLLPDEIE